MLETRYEEYRGGEDKIPFIAHFEIDRNEFSFSKEANWHENLEIEYIESGSGFVIIDGIRFEVSSGDVIIINSNSIHYTGTLGEMIYSCIIMDSKFCLDNDINHNLLRFEIIPKNTDPAGIFRKIKEAYNQNTPTRVAKCRILSGELLLELFQNHLAEELHVGKNPDFLLIRGALKYIRENFNRKITLQELSRVMLVGKFTLSRKFKALVGKTVIDYTNYYRILRAAELIQNGEQINAAAGMCGFNNMSFFTKTFKKYTGKLPSEAKRG